MNLPKWLLLQESLFCCSQRPSSTVNAFKFPSSFQEEHSKMSPSTQFWMLPQPQRALHGQRSESSESAGSADFRHEVQCLGCLSGLTATLGCWESQLLHAKLGQDLDLLQCLANIAGAIKEKICAQVSLLFGNCLSGSAAR